MKCNYPNCRKEATLTPVVEVPTYRIGAEGNVTASTAQPTFLLCREVCEDHKATYALSDWISETDWKYVQEAAAEEGLSIPSIQLVGVRFMPLGWHPKKGYMELERTH